MRNKIVIIEQPLNNRGDESAHRALVKSLLEEIKDCTIQVVFIGYKADSINQFKIQDENVEYIRLENTKWLNRAFRYSLKNKIFIPMFFLSIEGRKYLSYLKNNDWVVVAPGGINMGGFQTWGHLERINAARILGKKIAYFARSFGPFPEETELNKKFKQHSLRLLHFFSFISIRDNKTEVIAKELGLKYYQTVDTAFLDTPKVDIPEKVKIMLSNTEYMVLVPNILRWHYAYKDISDESVTMFYEKIIDHILKEYPLLNIIMLPQTFNEEDSLWNDINFFHQIKERINSNRVIVLPDTYSSDIQQTIISGSKFLIGARYHSVVFSINQNIPFIALSYEHKISGLIETLEIKNCIVQIQNIFQDKSKIEEAAELVFKLLPTIEKNEHARIKAKEIAKEAMLKFAEIINTGL